MAVSRKKRRSFSKQETTPSEFKCAKDMYPNYRDFGRTSFENSHKFYASTPPKDTHAQEDSSGRGRGGKKSTFPKMLYEMVDDAEDQGYTDVIAWMPHGRSFVIKDKDRFTDEILPRHFGSQNSFASFQRQLNVYGFLRMTKAGPDRKSYYHELFLRGRQDLISIIPRKRKTTARVRRSLDPTTEPNLYLFPPCLPGVEGFNSFATNDHDAEIPATPPSSSTTIQAPDEQTSSYDFTFDSSPNINTSEAEQVPVNHMSNEEEGVEAETSSTSSSMAPEVSMGSDPYYTSLAGAATEWWHSQFIVVSPFEDVPSRITAENSATTISCFGDQPCYDSIHDVAVETSGTAAGYNAMSSFWEDVALERY
jgi:HSF-type DNA-binding